MHRRKESNYTAFHLSEANSKNGTKIIDLPVDFMGKSARFQKKKFLFFLKKFNKANIMP